jgi:hypothetical protein
LTYFAAFFSFLVALVVATPTMHFPMLHCNLSIADTSSRACLAFLFLIFGRPCPVAGKGAVG